MNIPKTAAVDEDGEEVRLVEGTDCDDDDDDVIVQT